jgi:ketopantoate reductase
MNERIRELTKCNDRIRDFFETGPVQKAAIEDFAESIVRECMKVASPNYMSTPEDSVYYVEQAIAKIAKHFGVE